MDREGGKCFGEKKAWLFPKLRFLGNKVYLLFLTEFIASVIMIFYQHPKEDRFSV